MDLKHFGFPVLLEPDHVFHIVFFAGFKEVQTGITQIQQNSLAPWGFINGKMLDILLFGWAEVVMNRAVIAN